jgi:hypothetical protein
VFSAALDASVASEGPSFQRSSQNNLSQTPTIAPATLTHALVAHVAQARSNAQGGCYVGALSASAWWQMVTTMKFVLYPL